jgi:hypothetical protein
MGKAETHGGLVVGLRQAKQLNPLRQAERTRSAWLSKFEAERVCKFK